MEARIYLEKEKNALYKILEQLQDPEKYNPINPDEMNSRKETLINGKKLYKNRDNVTEAFENEVFPFKDGFYKKIVRYI